MPTHESPRNALPEGRKGWWSWRNRILFAILGGTFLFLFHHLAAVSAVLAPPEGYEPAWTLRNLDVPQYLTWMSASRDGILLPDYHAPWKTEPALLQPLFWLLAQIGGPVLAVYQTAHWLLYMVAFWVALWSAEVFTGRRKALALVFAAAAVPVFAILWPLGGFGSVPLQALGISGMAEYSLISADGVFRDGLSNSMTITVGTTAVLVAFTLLARYLETGRRPMLQALVAVTLAAALLHPFEVFTIVPVSLFCLWRMRKWMAGLAVAGAAGLGLAPYLALSVRFSWLRDASGGLVQPLHPLVIVGVYGIPCILTVYLLLMRFRMPEPRDLVLRAWFIMTPLICLIPGVPFPWHLLDGFAFAIGFLLVRRLECDPQLSRLFARYPWAPRAGFAAIVIPGALVLIALAGQLWKDGRRVDPEWFLTALRPRQEGELLAWLDAHSGPDDVILVPEAQAPWVAALPRHTLASHDFLGITYARQAQAVKTVQEGGPDSLRDLEKYGVRFVVLPSGGDAAAAVPDDWSRTRIGTWTVAENPEAHIARYPGGAALGLDRSLSLAGRVLEWLAGTPDAEIQKAYDEGQPSAAN